MANYIHALNINTAGVANTRSAAFNNADLDVIETRIRLDW
jgi:phosphate-selective porin OprO/OprP